MKLSRRGCLKTSAVGWRVSTKILINGISFHQLYFCPRSLYFLFFFFFSPPSGNLHDLPPRSAGRINERFPRMQIQLRYAVMAAIKVVRVIPDTYVEESSFSSLFLFLFLSLSLFPEGEPFSRLRCYENNWNPIVSNRRPIMQKCELFRKIFSSRLHPRLHPVCIFGIIIEMPSGKFFEPVQWL